MSALVVYAILCVAPAAVFKIGIEVVKHAGDWFERRQSPPVLAAPARTIEDMTASLARLQREYRRVEKAPLPARATRLRALGLAYDDTLLECCRELGLPAPTAPLAAVDRLATEATLAQQGLTW